MTALQFNVSQLLKSDVGSTRAYDFEESGSLELGDTTARDIRGHVKFTLTNFGILAGVAAAAALDLTCARCVEPFEMPTTISFEEEYQPSIDILTGLPSTTPRSDLSYAISQNHTIDLGEAIREHLLLTVELIPLCRPECEGLCATCGVNLNVEECTCPPVEEVSPLAAALQGWLGGSESEK